MPGEDMPRHKEGDNGVLEIQTSPDREGMWGNVREGGGVAGGKEAMQVLSLIKDQVARGERYERDWEPRLLGVFLQTVANESIAMTKNRGEKPQIDSVESLDIELFENWEIVIDAKVKAKGNMVNIQAQMLPDRENPGKLDLQSLDIGGNLAVKLAVKAMKLEEKAKEAFGNLDTVVGQQLSKAGIPEDTPWGIEPQRDGTIKLWIGKEEELPVGDLIDWGDMMGDYRVKEMTVEEKVKIVNHGMELGENKQILELTPEQLGEVLERMVKEAGGSGGLSVEKRGNLLTVAIGSIGAKGFPNVADIWLDMNEQQTRLRTNNKWGLQEEIEEFLEPFRTNGEEQMAKALGMGGVKVNIEGIRWNGEKVVIPIEKKEEKIELGGLMGELLKGLEDYPFNLALLASYLASEEGLEDRKKLAQAANGSEVGMSEEDFVLITRAVFVIGK